MNSVGHCHHYLYLNTQARADLTWWASLLPVFNCKSLFPDEFPMASAPAFNDASIAGGGFCWMNDWLYVNWSLDFPDMYPLHINYKETFVITIPLPHLPGHPLCPYTALLHAFQLVPAPLSGPAFVVPAPSSQGLIPFTHGKFDSILRLVATKAGLDPSRISGNSLRAGGATLTSLSG